MKSNKSRGIFLLDLVIINVSFFGYYVYALRQGFVIAPYAYILFISVASLSWLFISINSSIHVLNASTRITTTLKNLFVGYSCLTVGLIVILAVLGNFKDQNKYILYPLLFAAVSSGLIHLSYLVMVKYFSQNGLGRKTALVIGGGRVAEKVINRILNYPYLKYKIGGVLADNYHESLPKELHIGTLDRFCQVVCSTHIDEVIIALPLRHEEMITDIVNKCNREGIRLRIVPDFFRLVQNRMVINSLDDIPLISVQTEPLNVLGNRIQKRIFDIAFSSFVLILFSPLFVAIAVIVKMSSPGPIIFKQKRMGANNKEFTIFKFRTMLCQDKETSDCTWTTANDCRVTCIGRFLRKTSLDELPQFWNVLMGDMSVVGPRPERSHFVEQFKKEISNYKVRHLVKPGITGWAQVNGLRGDTSIPERIKHDIFYLQYWSIWLDLKIIFLTVFNMASYENAY